MERFWKHHLDHLLFWLITVGFHVYTRLYMIDSLGWGQFLLEIIIRNGLLAILIYANSLFLIPAYAQQRKFLAYFTGLLIAFGFYILLKNTHDVFLTVFTGQSALPFWRYSFYNFSIALFYVAFSLALQLSKEWYFQRDRLRQMEVDKLNTEIAYLKAQINPHFLFNSLNTIFFQIDRANAPARDTLTKFSDMLRFQLYECNGHAIEMEKEIAYLRNYVDLQRLRKDARYEIVFEVFGRTEGMQIAPLLLIPVIENAFKYVSHFAEGGNKVQISITGEPGVIELKVVNTTQPVPDRSKTAGGIGLKNLYRRLELQYPGRHLLETKRGKNEFTVHLKIWTNETELSGR